MPHIRIAARLWVMALLGLAASVAGSGVSVAATTYSFSTLYAFAGGTSDGGVSEAGLIFDASGALYGTTWGGNSYGTVFKLIPPTTSGGTWTDDVLYRFAGGNDGLGPLAGVIFDFRHALYGTTYAGGTYGYGTVFKLTPPTTPGGVWTEGVLYNFTGENSDGGTPEAGLIFDASGALYGTTSGGGPAGVGTVFKLTPPTTAGGGWTETVLHSFCHYCSGDGSGPEAGLIFDASGALYGTTVAGGTYGYGTVFKFTPPTTSGGAWTEGVLHNFTGSDGASSHAGLIFDASGALYGTTVAGGTYGYGAVFKLTPPMASGGTWTETVLHSFSSTDGASPYAGLTSDTSGILYSTTAFGGNLGCLNNLGCGTVFALAPPTFAGIPGQSNCHGKSVSALAQQYEGLDAAAMALGYPSVQALQDAIQAFCVG